MSDPPKPTCREQFEIAIICALRLEYDAISSVFDRFWDEDSDPYGRAAGDLNIYTTGCIGKHNIVLTLLAGEGKANAASAAASIRSSYTSLRLALLVGICGGVPNTGEGEAEELLLGDVVVSTKIVQYDFGKQYPNAFKRKDTLEDSLGRPDKAIRTLLATLQTDHKLRILQQRTAHHLEQLQTTRTGPYKYPGTAEDKLFSPNYRHKHQNATTCVCKDCHQVSDPVCGEALTLTCADLQCDERHLVPRKRLEGKERQERDGDDSVQHPVIHFGRIASGDSVMKSGKHRDDIAKDHSVIAFEMESAGVWNEVPCLVIKGVSDYADSHKKDRWQGFAAATAAAAMKAVLECYPRTDTSHEPVIIPKEHEYPLSEALLPYVSQAMFDAAGNDQTLCLQNTRVDVCRQVITWAHEDNEKFIFWLSGMAGTGKSTIARTVADEFQEQGWLGASFFFSRDKEEVSHAGMFVTTIAWQLATNVPLLRNPISTAAKFNPNITAKTQKEQWKRLIHEPLSKLDTNSRQICFVLVIDALDECKEDSEVRGVLDMIFTLKALKMVQPRIFVTSRPETHIRLRFLNLGQESHHNLILHEIPRDTVNNDISLYLTHRFQVIQSENEDLSYGWPGTSNIDKLVSDSDGLFIYAAIVSRFIEGNIHDYPADNLLCQILRDETIAKLSPGISRTITTSALPTRKLDEMFKQILRHSLRNTHEPLDRERLAKICREILGTIVILFDPLSAPAISALLDWDYEVIKKRLDSLRAILNVPASKQSSISLCHQSFRDFILDNKRCDSEEFWVDEKQTHKDLASKCIKLMSATLKKNICGLLTPGAVITDVKRSQVEQCITQEVQYACLYWAQHLQKSGDPLDIRDGGQVHKFLLDHFLHWLETLSLMKKVPEVISAIYSLEESIADADYNSNLRALVHDSKRFVLYHRSMIEEAPLQLYCSALVFAPELSIVRKQFHNQIPDWICRSPTRQRDWSPCEQVLHGHSSGIWGVAFSPDGMKVVVLGSRDHTINTDPTIQIWNVAKGQLLHTLEVNSWHVSDLAFSSDSKMVISGCGYTPQIWDATTGKLKHTLIGHVNDVNGVALSPDGKKVASGSDDSTVRIWDVATGHLENTLVGHDYFVTCVAFSPDSKRVASGYYYIGSDRTVRIWDVAESQLLQMLEGHSNTVASLSFSPDGKKLAAAYYDSTVWIWDCVTGHPQRILEPSTHIQGAAFSLDIKKVVFAYNDKTSRIWDMSTGELEQILEGHSDLVQCAAFSPDGQKVISGSYDRTARIWNVTTGQQTRGNDFKMVNRMALSPDGKKIVSGSLKRPLQVWDIATGRVEQTLDGHSYTVGSVASSLDSKHLASGLAPIFNSFIAELAHLHTGPRLRGVEHHSDTENSTGKEEEEEKEEAEEEAEEEEGEAEAETTLPGPYDFSVGIWDTTTGQLLRKLGHSDTVQSVAFSPDGKKVVSGSKDCGVRIWDITTGQLQRTLVSHSDSVLTVAFSPDGNQVISASYDMRVLLWDITTGQLLWTTRLPAYIWHAAFSPDGKELALGSEDHTIQILEVATGRVRNSLDGHSSLAMNVIFSPEPHLLYSVDTSERWVTWKGSRILYLPSDFRPGLHGVVASRGTTLTVGSMAGCMFEITFNVDCI